MQSEILLKLIGLLSTQSPFLEEYHVMYFLLESRKLMDREINVRAYPIIRFYADWCVHTEKSYSLQHITPMLDSVYKEAENKIENHHVNNGEIPAINMNLLRDELDEFLNYYHLPANLTNDNSCWTSFLTLLIHILIDQPIVSAKHMTVSELCFIQIQNNTIEGRISFKTPISNFKEFYFENPIT